MGHGVSQSVTSQRYNGVQVGASAYGGAVPLLYGRQRLPFTLTDYVNFKSMQTSSGGKGGGGKGGGGLTYSASFTATICEGPITAIQMMWNDKDVTTLSKQGLTLFTGGTPIAFASGPNAGATSQALNANFPLATGHWMVQFSDGELRQCAFTQGATSCSWTGGLANNCTAAAVAQGQLPWSYLTTNFPTHAIPYDHLCYVAAQNFALGESASMPNFTFEVDALVQLADTALSFANGLNAGQASALLSVPFTGTTGNWTTAFSDGEQFFCSYTNGSTAVEFSQPLANAATSAIVIGGYPDSDPSQMLPDYVTEPSHGLGLASTFLANLAGNDAYQGYVMSMGMVLSPYESTQRTASDFIKEILQITNSEAVWSGGQLKIIPYADTAVAGNGMSYTPNLTPVFSFTDDDYIHDQSEAPVKLRRIPDSETFNHARVEYLDRSNDYAIAVAEATDLGNIVQTGTERVMSTLSFHEICSSTTARLVAQLALQISLYERNTYTFRVRHDYCCLEPMDYVELTDANLGLSAQLVRITKVTIDEHDECEFEAMLMPGTARTSPLYTWQAVQGYNANWGVSPGDVATPVFFEPPATLVDAAGGRNLWIGIAPPTSGIAWGGAQAWMSFDGVSYNPIGPIPFASRFGTITAAIAAVQDPDQTSTLQVSLQNTTQVLEGGTQADADNDRFLIAVDSGSDVEIMSFQNAALISAGNYDLTYLRRGQFGTPILPHSSGAQFIRLDGNMVQLPLDPGLLGVTLYFKFTSFNIYGRNPEELSAATAYTYTPDASAIAYNAVSESVFSADGSAVVYSPTTAFKQSNGASAWDSAIWSAQAFTNGCNATLIPSQTTGAMLAFGLTTTPP